MTREEEKKEIARLIKNYNRNVYRQRKETGNNKIPTLKMSQFYVPRTTKHKSSFQRNYKKLIHPRDLTKLDESALVKIYQRNIKRLNARGEGRPRKDFSKYLDSEKLLKSIYAQEEELIKGRGRRYTENFKEAYKKALSGRNRARDRRVMGLLDRVPDDFLGRLYSNNIDLQIDFIYDDYQTIETRSERIEERLIEEIKKVIDSMPEELIKYMNEQKM